MVEDSGLFSLYSRLNYRKLARSKFPLATKSEGKSTMGDSVGTHAKTRRIGSSNIVISDKQTTISGKNLHPILQMQQTIGNQAVQRLLHPESGMSTPAQNLRSISTASSLLNGHLSNFLFRATQYNFDSGAAIAGRTIQRLDEPEPTTEPGQAPEATAPGREPTRNEADQYRGALPKLKEFRILREADGSYNCFAWAVGIDTHQILNSDVEKAGYSPNLDGWTSYLKVKHGFGTLRSKREHDISRGTKGRTALRRMTFSSSLSEKSP